MQTIQLVTPTQMLHPFTMAMSYGHPVKQYLHNSFPIDIIKAHERHFRLVYLASKETRSPKVVIARRTIRTKTIHKILSSSFEV